MLLLTIVCVCRVGMRRGSRKPAVVVLCAAVRRGGGGARDGSALRQPGTGDISRRKVQIPPRVAAVYLHLHSSHHLIEPANLPTSQNRPKTKQHVSHLLPPSLRAIKKSPLTLPSLECKSPPPSSSSRSASSPPRPSSKFPRPAWPWAARTAPSRQLRAYSRPRHSPWRTRRLPRSRRLIGFLAGCKYICVS